MSNLKAAQDVHHRLEFYLVALAFTTAAFATQTGRFTGLAIGDFTEASSWVLFVLSGVLGLMRLEYLPVAYRVHDAINVDEQSIRELEDNEEHRDAVSTMRAKVAETESQLRGIEGKNRARYVWQMRLLVAGLGMLLMARVIAQTVEHY